MSAVYNAIGPNTHPATLAGAHRLPRTIAGGEQPSLAWAFASPSQLIGPNGRRIDRVATLVRTLILDADAVDGRNGSTPNHYGVMPGRSAGRRISIARPPASAALAWMLP